jgi:hypothetical protein
MTFQVKKKELVKKSASKINTAPIFGREQSLQHGGMEERRRNILSCSLLHSHYAV